jgi:hypothetical protein
MTSQRGTAADSSSTGLAQPALEERTDTESICGRYAAVAGQVLKSEYLSRLTHMLGAASRVDPYHIFELKPLCALRTESSMIVNGRPDHFAVMMSRGRHHLQRSRDDRWRRNDL